MIRNRIIVEMHGQVLIEQYDNITQGLWNTTAKEYTEKHDYAIARLQECYFNEETTEQTNWETIAELRGQSVR